MAVYTPRSFWSFLVVLCLTAFALNWVWEMAQMRAYVEMAGRSWQETVPRCTVATLGDVVLTLAVWGVAALAAGRLRWGASGGWNVYAAAVLLGAVCAMSFEWFSLATGRWSYSSQMPVVPLLRVGLWPLLQLTLLTPVAFWIAAWAAKHRQ